MNLTVGLPLCFVLACSCSALGSQEEPSAFPEQESLLRETLVKLGARPGSAGLEAIQFTQDAGTSESGFSIASDGTGVVVTAPNATGAAQAAATLLRHAKWNGGELTWPEFESSHAPDLPYRSFMVDMGRNPHSPETLRQIVDMLWFYRANLLHLHLTDDQLISWPSKAFPKLSSERAGWAWEDFVALESYAARRGVAIIPEVDVPGHSTILRREYPEIFGESPTDLATLPSAQAGVETLLGEMLEVFRSAPYVHIGGDEAYGVPEELQRDFINRLNVFVKSRGRRTVVWEGPGFGEGNTSVDRDVLHINWRTINFPAQEMLAAGYEVVNAAWFPMYVVDHYPRTMFTAVGVRECFEWEPRRFAHIDAGMPTFALPHETESARGILGFCMPWWEGREENLMPLCLPRFAAVATAAFDLDREGGFEAYLAEYERTLPRLLKLSGISLPELPMAPAETQTGNLAFARPVSASRGATQPHFGPQRLTNGITDRFDHFLGFPTRPEPLEITIALDGVHSIDRVVVHEDAVGESFEQYRLELSVDGTSFVPVAEAVEGSRGAESFVEHTFEPTDAAFVRLSTDGCQQLTFPSFSRLVEVQVFAAK